MLSTSDVLCTIDGSYVRNGYSYNYVINTMYGVYDAWHSDANWTSFQTSSGLGNEAIYVCKVSKMSELKTLYISNTDPFRAETLCILQSLSPIDSTLVSNALSTSVRGRASWKEREGGRGEDYEISNSKMFAAWTSNTEIRECIYMCNLDNIGSWVVVS